MNGARHRRSLRSSKSRGVRFSRYGALQDERRREGGRRRGVPRPVLPPPPPWWMTTTTKARRSRSLPVFPTRCARRCAAAICTPARCYRTATRSSGGIDLDLRGWQQGDPHTDGAGRQDGPAKVCSPCAWWSPTAAPGECSRSGRTRRLRPQGDATSGAGEEATRRRKPGRKPRWRRRRRRRREEARRGIPAEPAVPAAREDQHLPAEPRGHARLDMWKSRGCAQDRGGAWIMKNVMNNAERALVIRVIFQTRKELLREFISKNGLDILKAWLETCARRSTSRP